MSNNPSTYLDAPDLTRLDMASVIVLSWLDTPYLVGSCLTRPDFRDVDVRVILDDKRYDALFPGAPWPHDHALRHLIEASVSEHYVRATGLRVDFQIQRGTQANARYPHKRIPLGIYPAWTRRQISAEYAMVASEVRP